MRGTDPREWTFIATLFHGATVFAFNCVCVWERVCVGESVRATSAVRRDRAFDGRLAWHELHPPHRIISASRVLEHAERGAFAVSTKPVGCSRALTFTVAPCN
jgi:hypothetical protein